MPLCSLGSIDSYSDLILRRFSRPRASFAPFCLFIALNLAILPACSNQGPDQREPLSDGEVTPVSIQEVQEAHTPAWMSIPGVVGTGIGQCDGAPCIKVFVAQKTSEVDRQIPDEIEGYPVSVEVTGPFRALDPDSG